MTTKLRIAPSVFLRTGFFATAYFNMKEDWPEVRRWGRKGNNHIQLIWWLLSLPPLSCSSGQSSLISHHIAFAQPLRCSLVDSALPLYLSLLAFSFTSSFFCLTPSFSSHFFPFAVVRCLCVANPHARQSFLSNLLTVLFIQETGTT